MEKTNKEIVTVQVIVEEQIEKVWDAWTLAEHIIQWNFASDDWHCPSATNDIQKGGSFSWRMESKDGNMGFDFRGNYGEIVLHKEINETLDDGRKVHINFEEIGDRTQVTETFEAEDMNPVDLQRQGWQAILENFKKHVESISS